MKTAKQRVEDKAVEVLGHDWDEHGENYLGIFVGTIHQPITGLTAGNSRTYWAVFRTAFKTRYMRLGYGARKSIQMLDEYANR